MPPLVNWFLRLVPTNPIVMRLVYVGSRQMKHLYIRAGYLALMIVVLLFVLLDPGRGGALSLRELASDGANMFRSVSFLQVALICLLTPVFMAGAIAQEANPRTWEIMLTTPLSNLQLVLGNLFGRLFFVIALLLSSLPLFMVIQYFGGVQGEAILVSYLIAACSALLVAAIAVTLSVTRTAGKRAVFIFYISVVMYLFVTAAIDGILAQPRPGAVAARFTSPVTPLNPFLAMRSMLDSNVYAPRTREYLPADAGGLRVLWMARPVAVYCWLCFGLSLILISFSTLRLRVIGTRAGTIPWYRRMFGLAARGATEREPRPVGHNPVVWRESVARGRTLAAMLGRWGFAALGVVVGIVILTLFHTDLLSPAQFRLTLLAVLAAEVVIITLAALNLSATSVSREREDGSLDIILTTPIQPGPYLWGKLVGLLQFLIPMLLVPVVTMGMAALYTVFGGLGRDDRAMLTEAQPMGTGQITLPVVLPEGALALPLLLIPFIGFCVMVGLHWSIRSKGTIGSVIAAVGVVLAVAGVLTACGRIGGGQMGVFGGVLAAASPANLLLAIVDPSAAMPSAMRRS
ncbi:MAG: ABC transporter permease subunit [Planctomycetota bacterium]|jgi:ABC-type transport system involved in multi-copper enzyme maturation permease subunit